MKCPNCNTPLPDDARFCENCGAPVSPPSSPVPSRSGKRIVLILSAVFLIVAAAAGILFFFSPGFGKTEETSPQQEASLDEKTDTPDTSAAHSSGEASPDDAAGSAPEPYPDLQGLPPSDPSDAAPSESPQDGADVSSSGNATSSEDAGASESDSDSGSQQTESQETAEQTADSGKAAEQETQQSSSQEIDIEQEIADIRELYYGIQYNLDSFTVRDGGGGTSRYLDKEGNVCKISAPKGSYSFPLSQDYAAEYYYDTADGSCRLRFAFVFGAGEEYRFYFLRDGRCIRYIGPDGQITDYPSPRDSLEDVTDKWVFCTQGGLEISQTLGG